jgi:hypothetical protein
LFSICFSFSSSPFWICFPLGFTFISVSGDWLANGFLSMAVQVLVAGLCKGELVDRDGGDGYVVCC